MSRSIKHFAFSFLLFLSGIRYFGQVSKIDSLLALFKGSNSDTVHARILVAMSDVFFLTKKDTVIPICKNAIAIIDENYNRGGELEKHSFLITKADAFNNIGTVLFDRGEIWSALDFWEQSLAIREQINDKGGIAESLNNMGVMYNNLGNIPKSLDFFERGLKILEKIDNQKSVASALGNIGLIHKNQGDIAGAFVYFFKSLKLHEKINDKQGKAKMLNNIGGIFKSKGEISKALDYYFKSLKIQEEIRDKQGMSYSLNNIAVIFGNRGQILVSLDYHNKSLKLRKEICDNLGIINSLNNIGTEYYVLKKYALAAAYCDSSLVLSKKFGFPQNIRNSEKVLFKIDSAKGSYRNAFEHYKQYILFNDSIYNDYTRKASIMNQLKYEFEKKELILKEQNVKEKTIALQKARRQKVVICSVFFGLTLVLGFTIFVFYSLKQTRKQKIVIEFKQKEILDSIRYAKRIQTAMLTSEKSIQRNLSRLKN